MIAKQQMNQHCLLCGLLSMVKMNKILVKNAMCIKGSNVDIVGSVPYIDGLETRHYEFECIKIIKQNLTVRMF
jgi:hypothetical protein